MANTDIYADSYSQSFVRESAFLEFLRERERNSAWETKPTNAIRFDAMKEESEIMGEYADNEIYLDTLKNTRLLMNVDGEEYPVRNCAIKTILERARISGNALNKVGKSVLAEILNHCIKVAPGLALLRHSEGKVSAVHGGDASEYAPLAMPELFRRTSEYLETMFPGCTFSGGFYAHSTASALWEMTNQDELLDAYKNALTAHGLKPEEMKPALRLSSSDVGISGANLYPTLFYSENRHIISLGGALKLEHKRNATLDKFDEHLGMIYSQYTKSLKNLTDLLDIEIRYPVNCMTGVMKRIGIPKKLAFEAIDLFTAQNGEEACTAHAIYYGISAVIFSLQCSGAEGDKIAQTEEMVARALSVHWTEYDMPGTVKW